MTKVYSYASASYADMFRIQAEFIVRASQLNSIEP